MTARHRAPGLPRILGRSKPRRRVGMAANFWVTPYRREVSNGLIDSLTFLSRRFNAYAAAEQANAAMWDRARADKALDRAEGWRS